MERNRWETAIRCLEIAVHPRTSDKEVIAAINGFRRTAGGMPLSRFCREPAAAGAETSPAAAPTAEWRAKLDRLARENAELRGRVEELEDSRSVTRRRLREAERRTAELAEELLAAEQRLAAFDELPGRIAGNASHESFDLQHALGEARRNLAQPIHEPVRPFQTVLNAALQRADTVPTTAPAPSGSRPWTA